MLRNLMGAHSMTRHTQRFVITPPTTIKLYVQLNNKTYKT